MRRPGLHWVCIGVRAKGGETPPLRTFDLRRPNWPFGAPCPVSTDLWGGVSPPFSDAHRISHTARAAHAPPGPARDMKGRRAKGGETPPLRTFDLRRPNGPFGAPCPVSPDPRGGVSPPFFGCAPQFQEPGGACAARALSGFALGCAQAAKRRPYGPSTPYRNNTNTDTSLVHGVPVALELVLLPSGDLATTR